MELGESKRDFYEGYIRPFRFWEYNTDSYSVRIIQIPLLYVTAVSIAITFQSCLESEVYSLRLQIKKFKPIKSVDIASHYKSSGHQATQKYIIKNVPQDVDAVTLKEPLVWLYIRFMFVCI